MPVFGENLTEGNDALFSFFWVSVSDESRGQDRVAALAAVPLVLASFSLQKMSTGSVCETRREPHLWTCAARELDTFGKRVFCCFVVIERGAEGKSSGSSSGTHVGGVASRGDHC